MRRCQPVASSQNADRSAQVTPSSPAARMTPYSLGIRSQMKSVISFSSARICSVVRYIGSSCGGLPFLVHGQIPHLYYDLAACVVDVVKEGKKSCSQATQP